MKDSIGDYAFAAMEAEKALKDIHYGIIDQKPEKAVTGAKKLLDSALELYDWVRKWEDQRPK